MGILGQIDAWLKGKKTYLVALAGIIGGIAAYASGDMTLVQLIQTILAALGLGALRSGVANIGK